MNEILYCNVKARTSNGKIVTANEIVFTPNGNTITDPRIYHKFGVDEPLTIIEIETIKSLGHQNKRHDYTEAKRSTEQRNTTTGAYD